MAPEKIVGPLEPMTTYAVALLYRHRSNRDHYVVRCALFTVSGTNPLTGQEILARAEEKVRESWPDCVDGPYFPAFERVACEVGRQEISFPPA